MKFRRLCLIAIFILPGTLPASLAIVVRPGSHVVGIVGVVEGEAGGARGRSWRLLFGRQKIRDIGDGLAISRQEGGGPVARSGSLAGIRATRQCPDLAQPL